MTLHCLIERFSSFLASGFPAVPALDAASVRCAVSKPDVRSGSAGRADRDPQCHLAELEDDATVFGPPFTSRRLHPVARRMRPVLVPSVERYPWMGDVRSGLQHPSVLLLLAVLQISRPERVSVTAGRTGVGPCVQSGSGFVGARAGRCAGKTSKRGPRPVMPSRPAPPRSHFALGRDTPPHPGGDRARSFSGCRVGAPVRLIVYAPPCAPGGEQRNVRRAPDIPVRHSCVRSVMVPCSTTKPFSSAPW